MWSKFLIGRKNIIGCVLLQHHFSFDLSLPRSKYSQNIFQIFTEYSPNIQTTVGGNDPNLKLRGPGRPGQPGPDDQHHGEHGVGGSGPVLDQHEVGWEPSLAYLRVVQYLPPSQKAWYIAKHLTYRSIITSSQYIYLYINIQCIYIQTCRLLTLDLL